MEWCREKRRARTGVGTIEAMTCISHNVRQRSAIEGLSLFQCLPFKHFDDDDDNIDEDEDSDSEDEIFDDWQRGVEAMIMAANGRQASIN